MSEEENKSVEEEEKVAPEISIAALSPRDRRALSEDAFCLSEDSSLIRARARGTVTHGPPDRTRARE